MEKRKTIPERLANGDGVHVEHRNYIYIRTFAELMYKEMKGESYKIDEKSLEEIEDFVDNILGDVFTINRFFNQFVIKFAEWAITQKWDKISASLGVDEDGNNIALSTEQLIDKYYEENIN